MLKRGFHTYKLGSPNIKDPSIENNGLNEKYSLGWVGLNSSVSRGFV